MSEPVAEYIFYLRVKDKVYFEVKFSEGIDPQEFIGLCRKLASLDLYAFSEVQRIMNEFFAQVP